MTTTKELPWRALMQFHMDDRINMTAISAAYSALIRDKDPIHMERLERKISQQMQRDLGAGAHLGAIMRDVNIEWPGDLFVEIETEIIGGGHRRGEKNYLMELCANKPIFYTYILAYFDRFSIAEYYSDCGRNQRRFIRELLYLMCMRLDPTFVSHLQIVANSLLCKYADVFLLPSPSKRRRIAVDDNNNNDDGDGGDGDDEEDDDEGGERERIHTNGLMNGHVEGKPRNMTDEQWRRLVEFLRSDHASFIPDQLMTEEMPEQLRALIMWIPFMLKEWIGLRMDTVVRMYTKLTYLQPNFDPRTTIGLYLYLCFLTPSHVTCLHRRVGRHACEVKMQRLKK